MGNTSMKEAVIDIKGVTKTYVNGKLQVPVLHGIDLQIFEGEFTSIMGPSGSGKSTLLNIIGLLDTPDSGSYLLQGRDVTGLSDRELAAVRGRAIGFIFQFFHLIPRLSAQQNIELPLLLAGVAPQERRQRSLPLLEAFGLLERKHHRPDELSGGQRQRVAIARAVINRPAILLADEPTGNLDSHSGGEIVELMERLNQEGLTLIVVTHDREIGQRAKRRIRVVDGRIASDSAGL